MVSPKYIPNFGDVHGWIIDLECELGKVTKLRPVDALSVEIGPISLDAQCIGNEQVSLRLCRDSLSVCELGIYRVQYSSEEEMQQNLRPLFFRLCIYAFLRVNHENIVDLKEKLGWKRIRNEDIEKLMRMDTDAQTIEPSIYKQAFNKIFSAASYFHFNSGRDNGIGNPESELKELTAETLRNLRPDAACNLVKSLASKFTEILLKYKKGILKNDFKISYSSSIEGLWTIRCYCPPLAMNKKIRYWKMGRDLKYTLGYQLLDCTLRLRHDVKIQKDLVEVELKIENLQCRAVQMNSDNPIPNKLGRERYFPAKISVTTGPQTEVFALDAVNSGASSSNPTVIFSESSSIGGGYQTQLEAGTKEGIKLTVGATVTHNHTNTTTSERRNWDFEASVPDNKQGKFQWTLYHHSYQKNPMFRHSPKHRDQQYKAFKELAHGGGPTSPFTEEGGVEFGGDKYGAPIKWTFLKEIKGQTLDWFVECEIWMAYYPNEYSTRCMEIRYQKFRELLQLPVKR
ncbi:hypothetical protein SUGI_0555130 [Cryptomeria japonica]|nr:hypothetical protein SUGI_0555130 [Cryptomeria japonica]